MSAKSAVAYLACLVAGIAFVVLDARQLPGAGTEFTTIRIDGVPHIRQKPDFCGEACTAMFLAKLGKAYDQDAVFNMSGVDPLEGRGARTPELKAALEVIGFKVGKVWNKVKAGPGAASGEWRALHADLEKGIPSIVCMRTGLSATATEHFRLIVGFDAAKDEVLYHEPAEAGGAYRRMGRSTFLSLWPLQYEADRWTVIRLRLEPGEIVEPPVLPEGRRYSEADYAQHIRRLKRRLPHDRFTIVLEEPFVVIGDESPDRVRGRARATVRWASEHLRESYFDEDPLHILDVWLFKDAASYDKHAVELFGSKPSTPFGYYSSYHKALVMNIATGGGTLVHEIVHPFVEANFPKCPAWVNEGLGSLYEQCRELNGTIWGLPNWRLRGLKKAIRAKSLPSFETLTAMSNSTFYGTGRGDNYAQSRYLLLYLQENYRLRKFYKRFYANRKDDPTGYESLKEILGETDMKAFQQRWEAWAMKLTYP